MHKYDVMVLLFEIDVQIFNSLYSIFFPLHSATLHHHILCSERCVTIFYLISSTVLWLGPDPSGLSEQNAS